MFKTSIKFKYRLHLFLQKHNEALIEDAICNKLKAQLQRRAAHHGQQAIFLGSKI